MPSSDVFKESFLNDSLLLKQPFRFVQFFLLIYKPYIPYLSFAFFGIRLKFKQGKWKNFLLRQNGLGHFSIFSEQSGFCLHVLAQSNSLQSFILIFHFWLCTDEFFVYPIPCLDEEQNTCDMRAALLLTRHASHTVSEENRNHSVRFLSKVWNMDRSFFVNAWLSRTLCICCLFFVL